MHHEQSGPASILAIGQFRWLDIGAKHTFVSSYVGLIQSGGRGIRIRLEDEARTVPR